MPVSLCLRMTRLWKLALTSTTEVTWTMARGQWFSLEPRDKVWLQMSEQEESPGVDGDNISDSTLSDFLFYPDMGVIVETQSAEDEKRDIQARLNAMFSVTLRWALSCIYTYPTIIMLEYRPLYCMEWINCVTISKTVHKHDKIYFYCFICKYSFSSFGAQGTGSNKQPGLQSFWTASLKA